jgi:hypothetical protein
MSEPDAALEGKALGKLRIVGSQQPRFCDHNQVLVVPLIKSNIEITSQLKQACPNFACLEQR